MLDALIIAYLTGRILKGDFPVSGALMLWIVFVSLPFLVAYAVVIAIAVGAGVVEKAARRIGDATRRWLGWASKQK